MSILNEIMKNQGGVFDQENDLCLNFGHLHEECDSSINHVFDLTDHSHLELTGEDRQKFVNNFCSAKIVDLSPGEGTEAFVLNISGHILEHLFVFVTENSVEIESGRGSEEKLFNHFDRYVIMEDVEIHRRSEEWASLFLTGESILAFLEKRGISKSDWQMNSHLEAELNQIPCKVRKVEILDQPGFIVCCSRDQVGSLWEFLVKEGLQPAGHEAFETLRIESGYPIYGIDITEDNLAQEASRTERTISFTKGCYLGQETVARIDSMGHVNKQLCRMTFPGNAESLPEPGCTLSDSEGNEAGVVTSRAWSPLKNSVVALGMIKRNFASPGTKLTLSDGLSGEVL